MDNLLRIKKASHSLYLLCSGLLAIIPLAVAFYWLNFNSIDRSLPRVLEDLTIPPLTAATLLIAFAVTMLPASLLMYGALQLRRLFRLYSTGKIFTTANCVCLRNLSIVLLAWMPVRILFDALISVTLTINNPPGQRFLSMSIEERELTTLLLGIIFLVVAWVMGEASRLQEEHAGIV